MLIVAGVAVPDVRAEDASETVSFNRDIRPILSDKCFTCHGPDAQARKAKLRLDLREEATREHRGTHAIVPGNPEDSEAVYRIFTDDDGERMPPPESNLTLSEREKALFKQWVAQGAEYEPHWSFIPLPKEVKTPDVRRAYWPRNDIDRFVLARLEKENLQPAAEATRERWLRRVTFDLTGLPPTPADVDAFLADASTDAYERVVDRLLATPQFGEKMAVHWLDVARYADSFGYQADLDSHAWPYRDWVIRAYNENLPFDKFITWQIAGDLVPDATREMKLATAFNRVHRKTQEGGSIEEEWRQEGIADRVHTFGTAFLGLTLECARCHDHKYDPISMRNYYELGAFFNNIDEWGLLHGWGDIQPHPVLYLTTPEQDKTLAAQKKAIVEAERKLDAVREARETAFQQWLAGPHETYAIPVDLAGSYDLEHHQDGWIRNAGNPEQSGKFSAANSLVAGRIGRGVQFTGDDPVEVTHANSQHMHDPISVAFWLKPAEDYPRAVVFHNTGGWDPGRHGYELVLNHGRLSWMVVREWPGNCISIQTNDKLPLHEWTHVAVTYDGSAKAAGLHIYLNGRRADTAVLRDKLVKDSMDWGKIEFGKRNRDSGLRNGVVDEIQIFSRAITPIEVAQCYDGNALNALLGRSAERTPDEVAALRAYYLSAVDPETRAATTALHAVRTAWRETMDQVREIPVMKELAEPRPAFVLARGAYDAPTERVQRETPDALPPLPSDAPRDRLGLARWLTDPDHPLVGRVLVNRFWQHFFGRGLVYTSENFGLQGELPSHPGLLDWLARDFIDNRWDYKRFCKQVVLSATYRQDSRTTTELRDRDPDNILLARGPVKRLSAEMLRDNAIALGGLLVADIGGPPVKPYQPDGSMWKSLNNFLPEYKRDEGAGLHRRSMYTFWRRTTPPPNMMVFDSGGKEVCSARRQLTMTPLQPLVLLNDPQFVEAARAFGEHMLEQGGGGLVWAFKYATGRSPTQFELNEVKQLFEEQLAYFREDPTRAEKLLQVGEYKHKAERTAEELAAAATTAGALLNLDATIMLR